MNEDQTRKGLIDESLGSSGWRVGDSEKFNARREFNITLPDGRNQYVDYTLMHNGKVIAVVEAKRVNRGVEEAREQARQYALNIKSNLQPNDPLPFVFYTNGHDLYFWDLDDGVPRKIKSGNYPTPDDLQYMSWRRQQKTSMSNIEINKDIAGRYYQTTAIRKVCERFEVEKKREALLVMATGTGKTRTATALVDLMQKSKWAKRVLFLVDRKELRQQALDAFNEHLPQSPSYPKEGETSFPLDRRIYVQTYHTIKNMLDKQHEYVSPFFFDLIIMDEAHRSLFNTFKEIIDYFDAYKLGLTATPKDKVHASSYSMFNCDQGVPTYEYSYQQGVDDKHLCDYEVLKVRTDVQIDGLIGEEFSDEKKELLWEQGIDPDEIDYTGDELEKKFTNKDTNRKILKELMNRGIMDESGTTPGKTIIFCATQRHAESMKQLLDELYPQYNGRLGEVITSNMERVHGRDGLISQFKNNDYPRIAFSVDMLDTGIDVREIVNLVFAKKVKSWIKFSQMIGRGTRILEEEYSRRKHWCKNKDIFQIIDCWENFDYFKENPKASTDKPTIALPVRLFNAKIKRLEASLDAGDIETANLMREQLRSQVQNLPQNSVLVKDNASKLYKITNDQFWEGLF